MNSLKIRNSLSTAVALAATLALAAGCSSTHREQAENNADQSTAMNSANTGRAAQTFTNDTAAGSPGIASESQSGTVSSGDSSLAAPVTITRLSQLNTSANGSVITGQRVNISNAKVDKVISEKLFTVKADDGTTIYVRTSQPTSGLTAGQMVNLTGSVRQTPSDTSTLNWDQESAQALQGQQFFIHVISVTPSGS
jgi:hypothetical protein